MDNHTEHERRFWRFSCGHIGGEIHVEDARQGSTAGHVRQLLLYEQSLTIVPTVLPGSEIPLRGRIEGTVRDLRCTICGSTRDWIMGEDALQQLLKRRETRAIRSARITAQLALT